MVRIRVLFLKRVNFRCLPPFSLNFYMIDWTITADIDCGRRTQNARNKLIPCVVAVAHDFSIV